MHRIFPSTLIPVGLVVMGNGACREAGPPEHLDVGTPGVVETDDGGRISGFRAPVADDTVELGAPSRDALRPEQDPVVDSSGSPEDVPWASLPIFIEVTLPAGTSLALTLDTPLASNRSQVADPVRARIRRPVVIDGRGAIAEDAIVIGSVTRTRASGSEGPAELSVRFDVLISTESDDAYPIEVRPLIFRAGGTKRDDARKISAPGGVGEVLGAMADGKNGVAVSSANGGGVGTAVVVTTAGEEVRLDRGTRVEIELHEALTVLVRVETDRHDQLAWASGRPR